MKRIYFFPFNWLFYYNCLNYHSGMFCVLLRNTGSSKHGVYISDISTACCNTSDMNHHYYSHHICALGILSTIVPLLLPFISWVSTVSLFMTVFCEVYSHNDSQKYRLCVWLYVYHVCLSKVWVLSCSFYCFGIVKYGSCNALLRRAFPCVPSHLLELPY